MITPAQLKGTALFKQLSEQQLAALAAIGTERSLPRERSSIKRTTSPTRST